MLHVRVDVRRTIAVEGQRVRGGDEVVRAYLVAVQFLLHLEPLPHRAREIRGAAVLRQGLRLDLKGCEPLPEITEERRPALDDSHHPLDRQRRLQRDGHLETHRNPDALDDVSRRGGRTVRQVLKRPVRDRVAPFGQSAHADLVEGSLAVHVQLQDDRARLAHHRFFRLAVRLGGHGELRHLLKPLRTREAEELRVGVQRADGQQGGD